MKIQLAIHRGVGTWNTWRKSHSELRPDLSGANLNGANLSGANLNGADLGGANLLAADLRGADLGRAHLDHADLREANFNEADLSGANLLGADLRGSNLMHADLSEAKLVGAKLVGAKLVGTKLIGAILVGADLPEADLSKADLFEVDFIKAKLIGADLTGAQAVAAKLIGADLRGAKLMGAKLRGANLNGANLRGADVRNADLQNTILVGTNLTNTDLRGCLIYGMSAWDLKLEGATQRDLIITQTGEPTITVDNIEVGQFIYLLLNNEKIRYVIDTITSKIVLILGRFMTERKAVLDALRDELRQRDYLPVLFDFDKPASKDLTGTVQTLANMARFIVADITDPTCIPHELASVIPNTMVAVQPILLSGKPEYTMLADWRARTHWVLKTYRYRNAQHLIANLEKRVIAPAESRAAKLQRKTTKPDARRTA